MNLPKELQFNNLEFININSQADYLIKIQTNNNLYPESEEEEYGFLNFNNFNFTKVNLNLKRGFVTILGQISISLSDFSFFQSDFFGSFIRNENLHFYVDRQH